MDNSKAVGFSRAECIAIVILAIAEISETTNLSVQTIFDYFTKSVEGLSSSPSNKEYAQAAATLWRLLKN